MLINRSRYVIAEKFPMHNYLLDNIETNVSNITDNVRNAAEEVSIASRHQKGARNRMCFLLLIFAAVGGVVVLAALA